MSIKKNIHAYAYWDFVDGIGYRTGTILVSNYDETVIGNVVMKNPGSAAPISDVTNRDDKRFEFSVDPTMMAVAELFGIDKNGGTVRIFNLSDIREANFNKAKKMIMEQCDDLTLSDDTVFALSAIPNIPTYIGWGDFWKNKKLINKAKAIFEIAKKYTPSLKPNIEDNMFFHPQYLMRYGRNKQECIDVVNEFRRDLNIKQDNTSKPKLYKLF